MTLERPKPRIYTAADRSGKQYVRRSSRVFTHAVMIYGATTRAMRAEFCETPTNAENARDRWLRAGFEAEIADVKDVTKPVQLDLPSLPPATPRRWTRKTPR